MYIYIYIHILFIYPSGRRLRAPTLLVAIVVGPVFGALVAAAPLGSRLIQILHIV